MTRINVIKPELLSDAWLLAEYRELPRAIKGKIDISDASDSYKLGKGHVKWAKKHSLFLLNRFNSIIKEMQYRSFTPHFSAFGKNGLCQYLTKETNFDYKITQNDINTNINRLKERYLTNPKIHKWTNRKMPDFLKNSEKFRII